LNNLQVKKLHENAILPSRSHSTDAGLDVYALSDHFLPVGTTGRIATGVAAAAPIGTFLKVEDRSSMAANGIRTGAGVVDASYRGDITVVLHNLNNTRDSFAGQRGYMVKAGDKIAQLVLIPILTPNVEEVKDFAPTERGANGFGSTGR
jgi:dUTP pyrophosphatase